MYLFYIYLNIYLSKAMVFFYPGSWRLCQDLPGKLGEGDKAQAGEASKTSNFSKQYLPFFCLKNLCNQYLSLQIFLEKDLESPEAFSEFRHRQATSELASHLSSILASLFLLVLFSSAVSAVAVNLSYLSWPGILQAPPRNCQVGGRFR